jgi:hypothetical protein
LCPGFESLIRHQISLTMRSLLALSISAFLVACGSTDTRQPDGSMLGTMTTGQLPMVVIDGKPMRLAPGARIVGTNNITVTPNQVAPDSRVRYKVDEASGQVTQVWLLPPAK